MIRRILLLPALILLPATLTAAIDADALIARLARPAPASIAFTEVRVSALLREPLVVSGELEFSGPASLDRHVREPYREDTSIRGESVRVEREGEQPRSFALKRAPELRGLLTGFSALLTGDVPGLKRSFDVQAQGSDESWTLQLVPLDSRARRRLQKIEITGHASTPRCFSLLNADGGASVMVLGDAAASVPAKVTLESVKKLCQEDSLAKTAKKNLRFRFQDLQIHESEFRPLAILASWREFSGRSS
jgi:Outer membrane lipoprotein carrier protein LolA-like